MNTFQSQLYRDLISLVQSNEAFYFQDYVLDGACYRIFNYRLSSYSDFLAPNALECRGSMFELDANGDVIRLAALPMSKFFNLNENPMVMGLDLSTAVGVEYKADGSLMSTYLDGSGNLRLKSKGSLFSEHAIDAMAWLDQHQAFKDELTVLANEGYTTNMEWCSARLDHRIVIAHQISHLVVLNARSMADGAYLNVRARFSEFPEIERHMIETVDLTGVDVASFVSSVPGMTDDIEGFIVELSSGLRFKLKTNKYLTAHRAKDSINSDRRLFEAVIDEAIDDVRSLFAHDALIMKRIDEMQEKVGGWYNSIIARVESFHETNKHLDRKDYAIKGRGELDMFFGLGMNKYLGRGVDYKDFIKSKWKELGIKDDAKVAETA